MHQRLQWSSVVLVLCLFACISKAQEGAVLQKIPHKPLEQILKKGLLDNMPANVVFEYSENWGHQANLSSIQGVKLIEVKRNHGNWHRMKAVCQDPARTIDVYIRHQRILAGDRLAFVLHVFLPVTLELEEQTWQNGIEVFSRRGRARLDLHADIRLETKIKWDSQGEIGLAEGCLFKLGEAKVYGDNFVPENIRGVGGDFARIAGGNLQTDFSRWQPRLENDAKQKLSAALLKLGETQEIHANLDKLIKACSAETTAPPLPVVLFQPSSTQLLCVAPPIPDIYFSSWVNIRINLTAAVKAAAHAAAHAASHSSTSSTHSDTSHKK